MTNGAGGPRHARHSVGAVWRTNHGLGAQRRPSADAMSIVQRSAAVVADRPVALVEAFYEHLFLLVPAARTMFPPDMNSQNEKLCRALLAAIGALVESSEKSAEMEALLKALGAQHAQRHGVVPEHYPYVGHALVRAVRDVSGDWSVETSSAWIWVYDWMSAHMLKDGP